MPDAEQLAVVGEDGWRSPADPPDSDRTIQLAWDDGSYGKSSLGFYDGIAEIPDSGKRWFWVLTPMRRIMDIECIGAWRDV